MNDYRITDTKTGDPILTVVRLWPNDAGDCPMCGEWAKLAHSVGWCCGPTHDEIGSMSTKYRDTEVGGMCVCKGCHDGFYAEAL